MDSIRKLITKHEILRVSWNKVRKSWFSLSRRQIDAETHCSDYGDRITYGLRGNEFLSFVTHPAVELYTNLTEKREIINDYRSKYDLELEKCKEGITKVAVANFYLDKVRIVFRS